MSALAVLVLLGALRGGTAPEYTVQWQGPDAGAGSSGAERYSVCHSAGRADIEPLQPAAGGGYALVSGALVNDARCGPPDSLFADGFE